MLAIRRAHERGHANHGWLDTHYSFSFADYYDPEHMGFRALRVMNEDVVQPGHGFGMHPHRDMEIVTFVMDGALQHRDSLGTGSVIRRGELQRITAGTGIFHSEFNPSDAEPVHLYQIWLLPEKQGLTPEYEQRAIDLEEARGAWRMVASRDGRDGALTIHQDARISVATMRADEELAYQLEPDRYAWLQVLRGRVRLAGETMEAGDGVAISSEEEVRVVGHGEAELMLFDLA